MKLGKILKIGLLFLLIFAIPVGIYLITVPGKTKLMTRAGENKTVFLFLMPTEARLEPGELIDFSLKIDTGQEVVGGVEVAINFDPEFLALVGGVRPGPAFSELTSQQNLEQIILRGEGRVIGQGTVVTLSFKGTSFGKSTIEIDEASIVWDEAKKTNILRKATGAEVVIE